MSEEENTAPVPAEPTTPDEETVPALEEPTPLDGLLNEFDALKQKVAQLEQLVMGHGHAFDEKSIGQIAQHVFKRINDTIRVRSSKPVQ